MKAKIRLDVVIAACYFAYTCIAAAILILVAGIGSQGNSGRIPLSLFFAIVLTSPLPMLFVGVTFLRRRRWAAALAVALALAQVLATAMQLQMARGTSIGELDAPRAALFYLGATQTFYLPGSLALAALSSLALLRRSD